MKNILLLNALIFLTASLLFAQNNVGIGTLSPDPSAILELNTNDKGILIPRVTTVQRTSIANPATGLLVYDTDTADFWYFDGTVWVRAIGPQGPAGPQGLPGVNGMLPNGTAAGNTTFWDGTQWVVNSNNIYNNGGNIGIGTSSPNAKLEVQGTVYGFMRHITHHTFNIPSWSGQGNHRIWLPCPGGDGGDDQINGIVNYEQSWVAPYDGRLVKVIIRIADPSSNNGNDLQNFTFGLSVAQPSNTNPSPTFSGSAYASIDNGQFYEFVAPSNWNFSKGNALRLAIVINNGWIEDNDYYVTAVWEYKMFD